VELVKCVLVQLTVVMHIAILQTVQFGGAECWETVTGLNWLRYGGKGVFSVLCEVSEMCLGTVDCDDAHCYSEHIEHFEQNSKSMTDRLKQHLNVEKLHKVC